MNILVIGGTGMIGSNVAAFVSEKGETVTVGARKPPAPGSAAAKFPVLIGDYTRGGYSVAALARFDAIVFSAGNDIRHIAKDDDPDTFWRATQIDGVPNFVAQAREAGVKRLVQLGSYYHQALPHLVATDAYVRARSLADGKARALGRPGFNVCTLNPPSIVGVVPGVPTQRYQKLVDYARGKLDIPVYAPQGGTNYMSVRSLSEAVWGALQNAKSGTPYLVGDENLSFRDYFQLFFDAVGNPHQVEARDIDHPLLPVAFIVPGRNSVLSYEPDARETAMLGYRRHDIRRAIEEIVTLY